MIKTKECRGKKKDVCPLLLLENSRPLSPLREPQTLFSFFGTPDFLSTCLGIDSHHGHASHFSGVHLEVRLLDLVLSITLPTKVRQGYGFSSGHVWMWEVKKLWRSWVLKNWCFWSAVLEKTLESPLDCKEIQPVHSEGDQPWDFFERNDAKAETPVLWPPHAKSWLTRKDSDAGRDWGQEEKGRTEDEMAGWHH